MLLVGVKLAMFAYGRLMRKGLKRKPTSGVKINVFVALYLIPGMAP
jgi:hypothetical protein